jgi:ATP-dependent Lhr-like helicase
VGSAGRWSLLRPLPAATGVDAGAPDGRAREQAIETFARVLLRRYGVVFRRLLEREALKVTWYELGRLYRRWEAQGEIRGGYFVSGVSGEQFGLPEAIGLLRSTRQAAARNELITLSAADPLNLVGILNPGSRIASIAAHRILLSDGLPVAALKADQIVRLEPDCAVPEQTIEHHLRVGTLPVSLRPYYA